MNIDQGSLIVIGRIFRYNIKTETGKINFPVNENHYHEPS